VLPLTRSSASILALDASDGCVIGLYWREGGRGAGARAGSRGTERTDGPRRINAEHAPPASHCKDERESGRRRQPPPRPALPRAV
jgi:hypothetical protein